MVQSAWNYCGVLRHELVKLTGAGEGEGTGKSLEGPVSKALTGAFEWRGVEIGF
jgi:hypothetical protein